MMQIVNADDANSEVDNEVDNEVCDANNEVDNEPDDANSEVCDVEDADEVADDSGSEVADDSGSEEAEFCKMDIKNPKTKKMQTYSITDDDDNDIYSGCRWRT